MKKIVSILCGVFAIIIVILIVVIIKMNSSINKINDELNKDKIEIDNDELICTGIFINKSDDKSNKYYIYDTKKNNFEIIFGDGSGNAIGTYSINNYNELNVVYRGMVLNNTTNTYESGNIEILVLEHKDCSAILIDGVTYTKISDEGWK